MSPLTVHKRSSAFAPLETFCPGTGYRLLPFRFLRWTPEEVLVTNDAGEHVFLPAPTFAAFATHRLPADHAAFSMLKAGHFLADSPSDAPVELLATKYRTKKAHLEGFTRLHLFVVTLRCDHSCRYCQVSRVTEDRTRYDMTEETARHAVDLVFRSPAPTLKFEFQGGEPLLNFELIMWIIQYAKVCNQREGRALQFVITTNLSPLTNEVLAFCQREGIVLSTSLDGPAFLHNANRPRRGNDSYERTIDGIRRVREALGHDRVSAIMTTTRRSLNYPREIVDEYAHHGFDAIFLRPISPYGLAVRTGEAARYEMFEFLAFYKAALARVLELNRAGTPMAEIYAEILLTKMLTPFGTGYVDLQSPAGAGIGVVAYNYDGDVYASDEARMLAEMGDTTFRLGNVNDDSYETIFGGDTLRAITAASVLEALPGCTDCAFLPYCGADPVFHHRTQSDMVGHRPTSAFCAKNMGIIRHLFELLRGDDPFVRDLLLSWATNIPR